MQDAGLGRTARRRRLAVGRDIVIARVVPLLLHGHDEGSIGIANNFHRTFSLCKKHRFLQPDKAYPDAPA